MIKAELATLFLLNPYPREENGLSQDIVVSIDECVFNFLNEENFASEVLDVYKKFIQMKDEAPESMKEHVFSIVRKLAKDCFLNNNIVEAAVLYRFLSVKAILIPEDYAFIAEIIVNTHADQAIELLSIYENKEENEQLRYITLANFYNFRLQDYKKAITYYEKYVGIDNTKPVIYSILGNLYSKLFGDKSLDKQIMYYESAYALKPDDRFILHGLAFGYEKLNNFEMSNKYYVELLKTNPTANDFYNYGSFLIHNGNFKLGHKYFTKRFEIEDVNFEYPSNIEKKWDFESDISDKTLLVHFEQGFGDTIMYCRFLPEIKKIAKKIVFVVQNELYSLIKCSNLISDGVEIVAQKDEDNIDYDVNIALLDLPYVLGTTIDTIPFVDGYLNVDENDIKNYAKEYLSDSNKQKVGIAYSGDTNSNYNGRNISPEKLNVLKNSDSDIYSFQKDEKSSEYVSLGQTFDDFYATACAIKNMDIVVSTDNVILNLAGALGVKTFGLYNYNTNFRWFKIHDGSDTGWYSNVTVLQADNTDDWDSVLSKLKSLLN